jgi:DCN1-like protein 1/2
VRSPGITPKYIVKAATQCEFTREEFVTGMNELGCDTIDKLKTKLNTLDMEILDPNKFKDNK